MDDQDAGNEWCSLPVTATCLMDDQWEMKSQSLCLFIEAPQLRQPTNERMKCECWNDKWVKMHTVINTCNVHDDQNMQCSRVHQGHAVFKIDIQNFLSMPLIL